MNFFRKVERAELALISERLIERRNCDWGFFFSRFSFCSVTALMACPPSERSGGRACQIFPGDCEIPCRRLWKGNDRPRTSNSEGLQSHLIQWAWCVWRFYSCRWFESGDDNFKESLKSLWKITEIGIETLVCSQWAKYMSVWFWSLMADICMYTSDTYPLVWNNRQPYGATVYQRPPRMNELQFNLNATADTRSKSGVW